MPDALLMLIPTDPTFVPEFAFEARALELLKLFIQPVDEVSAEVTHFVELVDPGENLGAIACPHCGSALENGWWDQRVDAAFRQGYRDLTVTVPCCGIRVSLNDLRYEWPVGFARFVLQAVNPARDIKEEQMRKLEQLLGCSLRKIWGVD